MTKHEVFAELKRLGAAKAVVEFSGGNDEGGVDDIALLDADGKQIDVELSDHVHEERDYTKSGPANGYRGHPTGRWIKGYGTDVIEATPEEKRLAQLSSALVAPVDEEYGSFAGDFSVQGTVTWDAVAQTAKMGKSEQVWQDYEENEF
jgi:hypothetical protein